MRLIILLLLLYSTANSQYFDYGVYRSIDTDKNLLKLLVALYIPNSSIKFLEEDGRYVSNLKINTFLMGEDESVISSGFNPVTIKYDNNDKSDSLYSYVLVEQVLLPRSNHLILHLKDINSNSHGYITGFEFKYENLKVSDLIPYEELDNYEYILSQPIVFSKNNISGYYVDVRVDYDSLNIKIDDIYVSEFDEMINNVTTLPHNVKINIDMKLLGNGLHKIELEFDDVSRTSFFYVE